MNSQYPHTANRRNVSHVHAIGDEYGAPNHGVRGFANNTATVREFMNFVKRSLAPMKTNNASNEMIRKLVTKDLNGSGSTIAGCSHEVDMAVHAIPRGRPRAYRLIAETFDIAVRQSTLRQIRGSCHIRLVLLIASRRLSLRSGSQSRCESFDGANGAGFSARG